jgi:hypothetical protein
MRTLQSDKMHHTDSTITFVIIYNSELAILMLGPIVVLA